MSEKTHEEKLKKLREIVKAVDICMLTTVDDQGGLHSRPMSNNRDIEFDGDLWFFTQIQSPKVTEISRDAEFTPKQVETRNERINLVYGAKVDLDAGWKEPLVPGQPAEVVIQSAQPSTSTQ